MSPVKITLLGLLLIVVASGSLAATDSVNDNSQLNPNREENVISSTQIGEQAATGELDYRVEAAPKSWSNIKSLWN